jgi:hypothetical protein
MMACPLCGGFGFIRKEGKILVKKANQFEQPLQKGNKVVKE